MVPGYLIGATPRNVVSRSNAQQDACSGNHDWDSFLGVLTGSHEKRRHSVPEVILLGSRDFAGNLSLQLHDAALQTEILQRKWFVAQLSPDDIFAESPTKDAEFDDLRGNLDPEAPGLRASGFLGTARTRNQPDGIGHRFSGRVKTQHPVLCSRNDSARKSHQK